MMATTSSTEEEKKLSATAKRFSRRFSLAEIHLATEDFSEARLIGKGGYGKVYKGEIDNGQLTVAIKQLESNSNQGANEFLMEIETLSKVRHVNLVSLIGYCSENREMILVYDYIAQGTLADHLYRPSGDNDDCLSLTWKQRLQTCIGAARGLEYLHTGSSIIHRDVKSTNILLDENFTAKVSDFGLAKHLSSTNSKSHVSTGVKGTFGYLDPSYFTTGRLTRKSDTYAFGVVLLEALCGRAAVDPRVSEDEISLVLWAQEKISKGKVHQIVASNLRDEISAECLKTFVGVAKRCLHLEPKKRPTMSQVVVQLEFALEQQERRGRESTYQRSLFLSLYAFWNRVKPSGNPVIGSAENVDVNKLSTAVPTIQEDDIEDELTADMLSVAVDESEDKHTVNVLQIDVPAIRLQELKDSTDNFSSHCLLGGVSRGWVYRGVLRSGQVAAIQRFFFGNERFLGQVSKLSELKHENVAQLLGYCDGGFEQFLVYEFAEKGTLHDILRGQGIEASPVLSWPQRVKIAVGAAKGLEYLHQKALFHHNIWSTNIFVFNNEVAKIGNYRPYVFDRGEAGRRIHVYSFGVVLLQLLTNGEVVDHTRPTGMQHIVIWATPYLSEDKVMEIVDARLKGQCPPKVVAEMAAIAALCVHQEAYKRPKMSIVVRDLCRLLDADSVQETQNL